MARWVLLSFILILNNWGFSQPPNAITYQKAFGGSGLDEGHSIVKTADGGFAVAGITDTYGKGGTDIFLIKFHRCGIIEWQQTYGDTLDEGGIGVGLAQLPDGGFVLCGYTTSFGAGNKDIFIVRTDQNGVEQWSRIAGGPYDDAAISIGAANNGNIAVTGYSEDSTTIRNAFITTYTSSGILTGDTVISVSRNNWGTNLLNVGIGFLLTGTTEQVGLKGNGLVVDYEVIPGLTLLGSAHYVHRNDSSYDESYNSIRTTYNSYLSIGSSRIDTATDNEVMLHTLYGLSNQGYLYTAPEDDIGQAVIETQDGNLLIVGTTESFGNGGKDIFAIKIDPVGNIIWQYTYGGPGDDYCVDYVDPVIELSDSSIIITGATNSFSSSKDVLLLRLDKDGLINNCNTVGAGFIKEQIFSAYPDTSVLMATDLSDLAIKNSVNTSQASFSFQVDTICSNEPEIILDLSDTVLCPGAPGIELVAPEGYTYNWSPGNYLSDSTVYNPVAAPPTTTQFNLILDYQGCQFTDSFLIEVIAPTAAGADTIICEGESVQLWSVGGNTYKWSPNYNLNDHLLASPIANPDTTIQYSVMITNKCGVDTHFINIQVNPTPFVFAGTDTTVSFGESVKLEATASAPVKWLPPSAVKCDTCTSQSLNLTESTTLFLVATDTIGCTNIDTVTIQIDGGCNLEFPNAFSPNDDGLNDYFTPIGPLNHAIIEQFHIYNRWGEKIFSSDSNFQAWDGTYKGEDQPIGVYAYHAIYTCNSKRLEHKGNITLLR